jgi:hypothetical protein
MIICSHLLEVNSQLLHRRPNSHFYDSIEKDGRMEMISKMVSVSGIRGSPFKLMKGNKGNPVVFQKGGCYVPA